MLTTIWLKAKIIVIHNNKNNENNWFMDLFNSKYHLYNNFYYPNNYLSNFYTNNNLSDNANT